MNLIVKRVAVIGMVSAALLLAVITGLSIWQRSAPVAQARAQAPRVPITAGTQAPTSAGAAVELPLHLVAVATGAGVEPRAFIAQVACGDARGYSVGDSPLLGSQVVEIKATEVVLETSAGLRRLPVSTEKCELPVIRAASPGAMDPAKMQKDQQAKSVMGAQAAQQIEEGKRRRAAMTPAEIEKYDLQANPECWPDEVPEGKTELDVIPEYCY